MHPLQTICFTLSMTPVNGKTDNTFPGSIRELVNQQAMTTPIYNLLYDLEKMVVHTSSDLDVEFYKKQIMTKAELFFDGVTEPLILDLMPAHMAFPRFPDQLFKPNPTSGEIELVEGNPYFDTFEDAIQSVFRYYIAIARMCGHSNLKSTHIIKTFTVDVKNVATQTVYQKNISEDAKNAFILCLDKKFSEPEAMDGLIEHFIINFIGGMTQQNAHAPVKIMHEGKPAVQNAFEARDWSEEDLAKPYYEMLAETSFDDYGDCPAYMSHYERLSRYHKALFESLNIVNFPMTEQRDGVEISSYREFYLTPFSDVVVSHLGEIIKKEIDKRGLSLGDLIKAYVLTVKA
ncbi:hypothetical protein DMW08_27285 [Vibrio parahaemolyticus]|nr:hypothetical protein [Vibrio parahaemolyticus]EGR2988086.1 hypothetical protein [Vibrio parahaemolyticus]